MSCPLVLLIAYKGKVGHNRDWDVHSRSQTKVPKSKNITIRKVTKYLLNAPNIEGFIHLK